MIHRNVRTAIENLLEGFSIVTLTGPRQSGKTTLARAVFENHPYASLEEPDLRQAASEDPRSFLARFPDGAVLDEVQRCPANAQNPGSGHVSAFCQVMCGQDGTGVEPVLPGN